MSVRFFPFGALAGGTPVTAARLENARGTSVTVLNYGTTVQSLVVSDRNGAPIDVVLGYDTVYSSAALAAMTTTMSSLAPAQRS